MQTSATVKLYNLSYNNFRTYLTAAIFIAGNIALPQAVHLIPQGGPTWLPIYLFTLIGAYKYGWKAGLLTAIASPIINSALFGMPTPHALPVILLKSTLLAIFAGIAASHFKKASVVALACAVLACQAVGTLGEWALTGSLYNALQDVRIGFPGIMLQIAGGWFILNKLLKN